jgi:hypothetical protein
MSYGDRFLYESGDRSGRWDFLQQARMQAAPRGYMLFQRQAWGPPGMNILTILLVLAMMATLGVLAVGLAGFFAGGEFNRKYGNKLMRARVALQALALLLLLAVLITSQQ